MSADDRNLAPGVRGQLAAAVAAYQRQHGGAAVAALLGDLSELVDSPAAAHAARIARGAGGGGQSIDDTALIEAVMKELPGARSLWSACGRVARRHVKTGGGRVESVQRRLYRKLEKSTDTGGDVSAGGAVGLTA